MGWAVCDAAQEPAHVPGLSETLHGDGKDPPLHRYKASLRVKWSSLLSTAGITCHRRSKTRGKSSPWIVDSHRTDPPRVCAGVRAGEGSGAPQPLCSNLSPSHGSFPPQTGTTRPSPEAHVTPAGSGSCPRQGPGAPTCHTGMPTLKMPGQVTVGDPRSVPQASVSLSRAQRP